MKAAYYPKVSSVPHQRHRLLIFTGIIFALVGLVVVGTLQTGSVVSTAPDLDVANADDSLGLEIKLVSVQPESAALQLLAIPRASGTSGQNLANGAFFTAPVIFNLDVAGGQSSTSVPGSSIQGAISAAVTLLGSSVNYPFDQYESSLFASAGVNTSQTRPIFTLQDSQELIPGFNIEVSQVAFLDGSSTREAIQADQQAGYGVLQWNITRSGSTIFIAILIAVIMIVGAAVSLAITWSIVRKRRPPSIAVMVWLAVFLFALFQVRGQLPGDPPAGVAFDRFVFFPVVLIMVLLIVVNLIAWSTREDWDLENPGPDASVASTGHED